MSITQCTATHLAEVLDGSHHEQQCAYVAGHSGDHLFSFHDESDAIRWKLAADQRDALGAENAKLVAQLASYEAVIAAAREWALSDMRNYIDLLEAVTALEQP